ncbi:HalOD1 output domain-containing protein [Haladaptatus sp. CMAA 1911]|uniref:HalOD1 output domain-containing protein n=1 Tax=unclassified Haladaptatus TaxID=2622732 RepID=UPI003754068B
MPSNIRTVETTNWFENENTSTGSNSPPQYALIATQSIDPDHSLPVSVIETVVETLRPPGGQTSLNLYQHVNPDALEELIEASKAKQSGVEVRFVIENHLVSVRSDNTVRIYEPLGSQRTENDSAILN